MFIDLIKCPLIQLDEMLLGFWQYDNGIRQRLTPPVISQPTTSLLSDLSHQVCTSAPYPSLFELSEFDPTPAK